MGKLLKTILFAIIYLIISYFLALQIAWLLSFNFDIIALSQQPKLFGLFSFTMDPNVMFWQGNTNYFKLASIIIFIGLITFLGWYVIPNKRQRERRAEERRLTAEEKDAYTHIANDRESKQGLQRFTFDAEGHIDHLYLNHTRYIADYKWWIGAITYPLEAILLFFLLINFIVSGINWLLSFIRVDVLTLRIPLLKIFSFRLFYIIILAMILVLHYLCSSKIWYAEYREYYSKAKKQALENNNWNIKRRWNAKWVILKPHIRDYMDYVFNPIKHFWNTRVQRMKWSDRWKANELKKWNIAGETTNRRSGLPIRTYKSRLYVEADDNHDLTIGTTNSGKTTSVVHAMIEANRIGGSSMFVNDIKKDLLESHYGRLKADNYNVVVFDFVDPSKSECWNPFGIVIRKYREAQKKAECEWKNPTQREYYFSLKKKYLAAQRKLIKSYYDILNAPSDSKDKKVLEHRIFKGYKQIQEELYAVERDVFYSKPDYSDAFEQLTDICRTLCEEKNAKQAHFWQQAQALMEGAACFLLEYEWLDDNGNICHLKDEQINFQNINNLTNEGFMIYQVTPSKKQCLLQWYLENTRRVTDRSYEKLIKITQMGTDERGSVMSTFANKMQIGLINDRVRKMTSYSSFSFQDFIERPTAIFMVVNDEKSTYHPFVSIFVTQLYNELVNDARKYPKQRLPIPWDIVWDEFGISPAISNPNTIFAASRFRGIRWHIVIQEYSQLDEKYGKEEAKTIKGNIMNTIFLLASTEETLREISERAGKKLKWNKETRHFDAVPVITKDKLAHLSLSEAVVLRQRKMPIVTRYYPYFWYVFNRSEKDYTDNYTIESKLIEMQNFSLTHEYMLMQSSNSSVSSIRQNETIENINSETDEMQGLRKAKRKVAPNKNAFKEKPKEWVQDSLFNSNWSQ